MKIINILFLLIIALSCSSQNQSKNLYYLINGYQGKQAILYSMQGDKTIIIDTAKRQSTGAYVFFNIQNYDAGMYSVYFNDSLYTELIINNEEINIQADARDLLGSMYVKSSRENKILFDYWKFAMRLRDSITLLSFKKQKIEQKTYNSNHPKILEIDKKISKFNNDLKLYIAYQIKLYPNYFAPKLLKSYMVPSMADYNSKNTDSIYHNEKEFYRDHFFDNIDFSDERFLNTKVIYVSINDYIKTFGQPSSTINYNHVIDKVMNDVKINDKIYEFCLDLFMRSFENGIWEDVFVHIIDNYYLPYYSNRPSMLPYYKNLSARIKALKPGKIAPNIILKDTAGIEHNLYDTKGKAKMIVFYSSDCPHCEKALPGLLEIFTMYKYQGLIAFGVAIDEDKTAWKKEIRKYNMNWTSVSDLKGLLSPLMNDYNIKSTPYIIILADDNVIMKKPNSINDIHATLVQLLNR